MIVCDQRATILGSFAYFAKTDLGKLTRQARDRRVEVDFMADSGAFTAFTSGKKITTKAYATWLQVYAPYVNSAMTLDVIGNPDASARNTLELEDMMGDAVYIIPIFHVGSPWAELERWCASHPFIALGGGVGVNQREKRLMAWLVKAHQIARAHGTVIHGLGMTRPPYPDLLPFYSVDSSFWSSGNRTGTVTLFDRRKGRWICVRHIDDMNRGMKRSAALVREYGGDPVALADPGFARVGMRGKELGRAERDWISRSALASWMHYADHLARRHPAVPTPAPVRWDGPKVYLAAGGDGDFQMIVDVAKAHRPYTPERQPE